MKIGNRLCFTVLHSIPAGFLHITSWILFGILIVDAVGSYAVLHHITKKMPRISAMNDQIDAFTRRLSVRVYRYLERRVERAYPAVQPVPEEKRENRNRRICRRMQLLQNRSSLHHRRIFGRYYRNHILPHHRRCLDEPQQPCLGPVQHRLGAWPSPSLPGSSTTTATAPMDSCLPLVPSSAEPTNTSAVCSPKSYSEKSSGTTATFPSTSEAVSTSCTVSSGE